MFKLKFFKGIISRVRWNVVISMIAVIVFILIAVLFIKPFSPELSCSDGVCMGTKMEPAKVGLMGDSTLWVDLKNRGGEDLIILVELKTRNPALIFAETAEQETSREIEIGSGESMRLNFNLKAEATYPGTYRTDVTARYDGEQIEDDVYLQVT